MPCHRDASGPGRAAPADYDEGASALPAQFGQVFLPEDDPELGQTGERTGNAPGDRGAGRPGVADRRPRSSATRCPARSVRRMSSVSNRSSPNWHSATIGARTTRRRTFIPWVSLTCRPKPMAQHEGEGRGHEAASDRPGVVGAGAAFAGDHGRWAAVGAHRSRAASRKPGRCSRRRSWRRPRPWRPGNRPQRLARSRVVRRDRPAPRRSGPPGRRPSAAVRVGRAVLADDDLEGPCPDPQTLDHVDDGRLEVVLLVVGRNDDGQHYRRRSSDRSACPPSWRPR